MKYALIVGGLCAAIPLALLAAVALVSLLALSHNCKYCDKGGPRA